MATHSKLSPSKADCWIACPGSVREESKYPDSLSGDAAIDGTHSHTLLEACLKSDLSADAFIGKTLIDHEGSFVVDASRSTRVQVAIDYVQARKDVLLNDGHFDVEVISERRVNPEFLTARDDMSGTCDIEIRCASAGYLEIIDYKDGMTPVDIDTAQLDIYVVGALSELKIPTNLPYPFSTIRKTIIQPKLTVRGLPPIVWKELPLSYYLGDVVTRLAIAAHATDDADAQLVPGAHCKYCKHSGNCATRAQEFIGSLGVDVTHMFGNTENTPPVEVLQGTDISLDVAGKNPSTMTSDQLSKILEASPLIRALLDDAEKEAENRIKSGVAVPGFKIVNGRGSSAWSLSEEDIADKLRKMGVPKGEVWVTKLISPAQLKKLKWESKKGDEVVYKSLSKRQLETVEKEYISRMAGKPTVVPETDSRPAITYGASELFQSVDAATEELPAWML